MSSTNYPEWTLIWTHRSNCTTALPYIFIYLMAIIIICLVCVTELSQWIAVKRKPKRGRPEMGRKRAWGVERRATSWTQDAKWWLPTTRNETIVSVQTSHQFGEKLPDAPHKAIWHRVSVIKFAFSMERSDSNKKQIQLICLMPMHTEMWFGNFIWVTVGK